jgi:hypothetical protein
MMKGSAFSTCYEDTVMKIFLALALILSLSACGVDVATSAATVAKAKAEEIKEAQKTKEHMTKQINAAMAADQKRLHDADQAIQ